MAAIKVLVYKAADPEPSCSVCRQHHLPSTTAILGHRHSRLCNSASLRSMCTLTLRFHFFLLLRFLPHTHSHTLALSSICVGVCAAFLSRITHMLNICCEMFQGPFVLVQVKKKSSLTLKKPPFQEQCGKTVTANTQNTNKTRSDLQDVSSPPLHPSGQVVLGCDGLVASYSFYHSWCSGVGCLSTCRSGGGRCWDAIMETLQPSQRNQSQTSTCAAVSRGVSTPQLC